MIASRYIALFAIWALAWCGVFLCFTWVIDPYGVSPVRATINRVNKFKPKRMDIDRFIKPYEVWRYQPRTVFLGTSRIQQSIDPAMLNGTAYEPAYNAAVPAASLSENLAYLEQYIDLDKNLKHVFVELFLYSFIGPVSELPRKGVLDFVASTAPLHLSASATRDSLTTVQYNLSSRVRPSYVHKDGYWVRPDSFDIPMYFIPHSYSAFVLGEHKKIGTINLYSSAFDMLKRMQELCDKRGVNLTFVVTPNYPWDDYRLETLGYRKMVREFYENISSLPNVVSFAQLGGSSEEPLSENMRFWTDPFHFSRELGSQMISSLLNNPAPGLPDNFMMRINKDTFETALDVRHARLQDWVSRNGEFVSLFEMTRGLVANEGAASGTLDIQKLELSEGGKVYPVSSGTGVVELGYRDKGVLVIAGWAIDSATKRPVEAVVATQGSNVVAKWLPTTGRTDVQQRYGRTPMPEGFSMRLPVDPEQVSSSAPIRIFALTRDGVARQLSSGIANVSGSFIPSMTHAVQNGALTDLGTLVLDGKTYAVVTRIAGSLESIDATAFGYRVRGWAADKLANRPVKAIVATVGSKVVSKSNAAFDRLEIEQGIAAGAKPAGFEIEVYVPTTTTQLQSIRIFGLMADGVAVPLAAGLSGNAAAAFEKVPFPGGN